METQQRIDVLESRQLALKGIMADSDDRASKCDKNGTTFREVYPDDYAAYQAANAEYNRNEQALAELNVLREAERAEARERLPEVEPENTPQS